MYEIIRMYSDSRPVSIIKKNQTLEQAQKHCQDPETSSRTCSSKHKKGYIDCEWFDGYREQ